MTREERLKKHLWKCYKSKSAKPLYRCINVLEDPYEDQFGKPAIDYIYVLEMIYENGTDVEYKRTRFHETYFLDMFQPVKESLFESLRDRAITIIRGGVIGDMPILKEHTEELFA